MEKVGDFDIRMYVRDPHRKPVGRHRRDDADRKARFLLRQPTLDESTPKRLRDSERALNEWRRTPIPSAVKNTELIHWLWQEGERVCPLCERDIEIEVTNVGHPGKPELDHIIAKAWYGDHVWGNVRVVHGTCNRFRGGHNGVGADYTPAQYRRVFDRALEAHSMADRTQAKSRMSIAGTVDSHLRRIEWYEEMLLAFGDPEAEAAAGMTDYFREGGPDRVRQAIAYARNEMATYEKMLNQLDWIIVGTNAKRALREARERRAIEAAK